MSRSAVCIVLALLLPLQVAYAGPAFQQLQALSGAAAPGAHFDGSKDYVSDMTQRPIRGLSSGQLDLTTLREAKSLLGDGTNLPDGSPILPFVFRLTDGGVVTAPAAGLEGFLFGETGISASRGSGAISHHYQDYLNYIDALLAPVAWAVGARHEIRRIDASTTNPAEKYQRLMTFVAQYTAALRRQVAASDGAAWVRTARIYEIFPRAFNLAGKRAAEGRSSGSSSRFFADFGTRDLDAIRNQGFDAIWVMGIFPIGERNRSGTGGGSPYSIMDHDAVHPDLGTRDEFRAFTARAHAAGLRVIIDFVPNHTSMDSKLLNTDPRFFVGKPAEPGRVDPPEGYFAHRDLKGGRDWWIRNGAFLYGGSRAYWNDTAQVDYSNPIFRREMIRIVKRWVADCGVDGFRVDMAYLDLNDFFRQTWGFELGGPMPEREFMEELTTEVKSQFPGTAFIAEGYDRWDDLSKAGFDLIYSKNSMERPGGHQGWYDSLASRDPGQIREAIRRASYLHWQEGASGGLSFIGNHDEASPQRAFGPWTGGASFLTLMMPGGLLFYGSQEVGFDQPDPREPKSIPFGVPVEIDWKADPSVKRFYDETFRLSGWLRAELGEADVEALPWEGDPQWVGYLLKPRRPKPGGPKAVAVLANPTGGNVDVRFRQPQLGIDYSGTLAPFGYDLARF